jgi:hypothetical protein
MAAPAPAIETMTVVIISFFIVCPFGFELHTCPSCRQVATSPSVTSVTLDSIIQKPEVRSQDDSEAHDKKRGLIYLNLP